MGYDILPADPARYADDIRADTVGFLAAAQVGRRMGEMAHPLSDRPFLRGDARTSEVFIRLYLIDYQSYKFYKIARVTNVQQKSEKLFPSYLTLL